MTVKKWLFLEEKGGDPWVLPIWSSIHQAVNKGRMKKMGQDFCELAGYVSIKLDMLPRIVERIKEGWNTLKKEVKDRKPGYEFTKNKEGYAFPFDDNIKYQLLIDIDSLLFELKSCCELMGEFVCHIYNHTGIKIKSIGKKFQSIIDNADEDPKWFIELREHRVFITHRGAPYIAVDLSQEPEYDLLIMKENLRTFDNEEKFIRLPELNKIVQGFLKARVILQEHLIQYIDNL